MAEVYFNEFRMLVIEQIRAIEQNRPETHSTEWFLLKYLRRIEKNSLPPASPGRMENCMRALIRFYVDCIDENTEVGERCKMIYEGYRKTLREAQTKKQGY